MLTKYIVGLNWADLLIIGILIRMAFIGLKTGFAIELFKLISLWFATIITFQLYTTPLADLLNEKVPALPLDAADVFTYIVIMTLVTLAFRIIRESFFLLIKIEAANTFDKIAGIILGSLRGLWVASIALFIMCISTIQYLETSAKSALFGHKVIALAPNIYRGCYNGLTRHLFSKTKLNEEVFKILDR